MTRKTGRIGLPGSFGGGGSGRPSAEGLIGLFVVVDVGDIGRGYASGSAAPSG